MAAFIISTGDVSQKRVDWRTGKRSTLCLFVSLAASKSKRFKFWWQVHCPKTQANTGRAPRNRTEKNLSVSKRSRGKLGHKRKNKLEAKKIRKTFVGKYYKGKAFRVTEKLCFFLVSFFCFVFVFGVNWKFPRRRCDMGRSMADKSLLLGMFGCLWCLEILLLYTNIRACT